MAWEDDAATNLALYADMEYSDEEQARRCVVNNSGTWIPESFALTVLTIPTERRDDFDADLYHRMEACVNLTASKAWPKEWLRKV